MLILDENLGLLDQGIVEAVEIIKLLQSKVEEMEVILTGKIFSKELEPYVDSILEINHVKVDNTI